MTPAERLSAAADTIERTAGNATPGHWRIGRDYGEVVSPTAPCRDSERELYGAAVVGETLRGGNAAHVALWDPPTALLAATLLRAIARDGDLANIHQALALADRILTGGAS